MDPRMLLLLLLSLGAQSLAEDEAHKEEAELNPLTASNGNPEALTTIPTTNPAVTHAKAGDFNTAPPSAIPSAPEPDSSEELIEDGCKASTPMAKQVLGDAMMSFGLNLLKSVSSGSEQPNVIVSPLSVSLALSHLAMGAAGDTEQQLLRALKVETLPCYQTLLHSLLKQLNNSALSVAMRMYLQPGIEIKPDFARKSQSLYGSEPIPLSGVEEINNWVKEATQGRVTDFLSSLPASVVLLLINAVHFKGEWKTRFDSRFTSQKHFFVEGNKAVKVEMMLAPKYPLSQYYHSKLEAKVARFPFKGSMNLIVIVPSGHTSVADIANKLNGTDLYSQFPAEQNIEVHLPKLKLGYSQELKGALTSLGLRELFERPNLTNLAGGPMTVTSVQHKSSMELNEEGVEAAAATSVMIHRSARFFHLNRPFFFAIVESITHTPLFLGVVTNPNPTAKLEIVRDSNEELENFDKNSHSFNNRPPK